MTLYYSCNKPLFNLERRCEIVQPYEDKQKLTKWHASFTLLFIHTHTRSGGREDQEASPHPPTDTYALHFPVLNKQSKMKRFSLPKMGVARFSTRETVEGRPATMHTIPSKKVEWGATARMGASPLPTCLPLTTTLKPMQK